MRLILLISSFYLFSTTSHAANPDGLPRSTMALLSACQDATYNLQFDRAEAMAKKAMAQFPAHPLPSIFLQMSLLARIQESIDAGEEIPGHLERFERESKAALALSQAWERVELDGRSRFYLGSCLGTSGLMKMQQGRYLGAYSDGVAAEASLRLAIERDPGLKEAYLGLGQYEYYCGRMSGLLRFVARLKGDRQGGIAKLEACARKNGYAATAARTHLARIYSLEETDFIKALPYVSELRRRYPVNHSYVNYALATARGLGWQKPEARSLLKPIFKQWDKGWRPPAYANLESELLSSRQSFKE